MSRKLLARPYPDHDVRYEQALREAKAALGSGTPFAHEETFRRESLNKNWLIAQVVEETSLSRSDAAAAVDGIFNAIMCALKAGDAVRVFGFGTFAVTERAAFEGRDPRTGESIEVKASKQPRFKAGKRLKEAL